jgi:hypothetical protein
MFLPIWFSICFLLFCFQYFLNILPYPPL